MIFWDEGDKRGWLVNGTGALLHLLRASLIHRKRLFGSEILLDPAALPDPENYDQADYALQYLMKPSIREIPLSVVKTAIREETEEVEGQANHRARRRFERPRITPSRITPNIFAALWKSFLTTRPSSRRPAAYEGRGLENT
jgi:hypothetical protein